MSTPRRGELAIAQRQLAAIEAFNRARRAAEQALDVAARSRETRMDAARRLEVLRREHQAVIARADEQLRRTCEALARSSSLRALVAHRHPWFSEKLVEILQREQVEVIERVDNGADAVGIVVAEQPDLVLLEDGLMMMPGDEVIREMRRYSPAALISAQVASNDRIGLLLDAGADNVVTRLLPPAEVVAQTLALRPRR